MNAALMGLGAIVIAMPQFNSLNALTSTAKRNKNGPAAKERS